jgi:hypothetical protein
MSSDPNGSANAKQIDNHGDRGVGWLPDGRLVTMDYDSHISVMNADGSNRTIVYQEHLPMSGMSVCHDGNSVLFSMPNKQNKAINVWRLDMQSDTASVLTNGTVDQNVVCAPDSKSFLYTTLVKGKSLLMTMPMSGGQPKQIGDKVVEFATYSPDAQQIAAFAVAGSGVNFRTMIEILPVQGGLPVKTFSPIRSISSAYQYSADGHSLYYPVTAKGVSNMVSQPIGVETVMPMTAFTDLLIYGYDYDWKNKRVAITRGRSNTDVVLLTQQQQGQ